MKSYTQELIEWLVEEELEAVAKGLVKFSKARLTCMSNFAATFKGSKQQMADMQSQKNSIGEKVWPKLSAMRRSAGMQKTIQSAFKQAA